jgi:protein-tyrosine-phosphatase
MARAFANRLLGDSAFVDSAGVDADTGSPANPKAKKVMKEYGLEIDGHRSKDVEDIDLATFDIIVALESGIAQQLVSEHHAEPTRLRELSIKDPYWGGLEDYRQCAQKLQAALPTVLK